MSPATTVARVPYQRIATEEAWGPPEMFERYRRLLADQSCDDPGFNSMWGFYLLNQSERPRQIIERLQDVGARRIGDMKKARLRGPFSCLHAPVRMKARWFVVHGCTH